ERVQAKEKFEKFDLSTSHFISSLNDLPWLSVVQYNDELDLTPTDKDSKITFDEFFESLKKEQGSEDTGETKAREVFEKLDADHDGVVDFKDFLGVVMAEKREYANQVAELFFTMCDQDGDGFVLPEDLLKDLLGNKVQEADPALDLLFKKADADGDRKLNRDEFKAFWELYATELESTVR
ncbi:hypothetical protein FS837_012075, partial [Tulasnella sp. UAMH 9824]